MLRPRSYSKETLNLHKHTSGMYLFICLFVFYMKPRKTDRDKVFHPLVHSSQWTQKPDWSQSQVGSRNSTWITHNGCQKPTHLGYLLLPPQAQPQEPEWEAEQPRLELALPYGVAILSCNLACCTARLVPSVDFVVTKGELGGEWKRDSSCSHQQTVG